MEAVKRTALCEIHESLGARMVEFAGFLMPVAYGSIIEEHKAVRERAGLFDVSHMGEFVVEGRGAKAFVNEIITNDCSGLPSGRVQYTVMCRDDGTVVDDLLVFVVEEERVILVVNAANLQKDFAHIGGFETHGVEVTNASGAYALIAIQGPRSLDVLSGCGMFAGVSGRLAETAYYRGFAFSAGGEEILVSRTGYTGELGYEIFVPPAMAPALWNELMSAGRPHGIAPVGLGARDTLRFEAGFCLYGHELDDTTSPFEAGLGWVVKMKKPSFRGREALEREKKEGSKRRLVGMELSGRQIARQGYAVLRNGEPVGAVTSGTFAPTLGKSLCMAYVPPGDGEYAVEVRGKPVGAAVTPLPFYPSRAR